MNYSYSVADAIRRNARLYPNKEGVIFADINARFTWAEFHERTSKTANALSGLGLKKGDRIAVLSNNSHYYLEIFYGCAKAGLIHVTMNPRLIAREIAYIINNCECEALIVSEDYWSVFQDIKKDVPRVKTFIGLSLKGNKLESALDYELLVSKASSVDPEVEVNNDDVTVIVNTSGTTGLPKGGMVTHWNFYVQALEFNGELGLKPDDVMVLPWPLHHIVLMVWHAYVLRGNKCVTMNFTPQRYAKSLAEEKCTVTWVVPTMLSMMLDLPDIDTYDLSKVRSFTWAAAPMPPALAKRCIAKWGNVFSTMLGATEAAALNLFLRAEDLTTDKRFSSVGRPSLAKKIKVVRDDGSEVTPGSGEAGEMIVSGCFFKGYYNDPERTSKAIRGNWLHTGDMMQVDEDGFLYLVDRKDFLIKTGGEKVYPLEVEHAIHELPQVSDVAVVGLEDKKWGEAVTAAVVLRKGEKLSEEEIIEHCRKKMSSFKIPKRVVFLETLPRDATGKMSKRTLIGNLKIMFPAK